MASRFTNVKERMLYLDSKNVTYNNDYDFQFSFKENISNVKSIQLISFNIPYISDTITTFTNKILIEEDGVLATATLSSGTYDAYSLAHAMKTALDAASTKSNTFTVTYSPITYRYTIASDTTEFTIKNYSSYTDTAGKVIGISSTTDSVSSARTLQLPNKIDLLPIKQLEIRLPGLIHTLESYGARSDHNDIIYLISLAGVEPYSYLTNSYTSNEIPAIKNAFNSLIVSIVDEEGYTDPFWDVAKYPFSMLLNITHF